MTDNSVIVWYAAAGDCEQVRSGLIGQPANAVSAAAYLLAGGWLLARVCRRPAAPARYRWFAAAVAANGVAVGPATNLALLTAVTAAVLAEAAVARRPSVPVGAVPDAPVPARRSGRRGRVVMLAALAVGVTAYLAGRTGSPLCRPDSLLQPHALWHVLTAVAMAAWAVDRITQARRSADEQPR